MTTTTSPLSMISSTTGQANVATLTTPSTSDIIINALQTVKNNPSAIQSVILSELEALNGGTIRIVDPTNPVVYTLESAAMMAAAAMAESAVLTRRLYPSVSQTEDDLFPHMTDSDYQNRFGYPATTTFTLLIDYQEFLRKAVPVGTTGISQLTIPRYTEIDAASVPFTLQYPIDIQTSAIGGIQVFWDLTVASPLLSLSSNRLIWKLVSINGSQYIEIQIPAQQFQITSYNATLNASTGFSKNYTFPDQFYYCRAFVPNGNGWTEIVTTQSALVYDPTVPTLALSVNTQTQTLTASVPQIYFTNNLIGDSVRIDVYTIQGPMNVKMSNYSPAAFVVLWNDLDGSAGIYAAPWAGFSGKSLYSDNYILGGANGLTFPELRSQVMMNSYGQPSVPITLPQLTTALSDMGFTLVIDQDSLMQRTFLATSALPAPNLTNALTAANGAIQTLQASISDLDALDTVYWNNGSRLCLRPSTLFQSIGGVLSVVPNSTVQSLLAMTANAMVAAVNNSNYLYTPFHYVYDVTGTTFYLRPYFLTQPEINSKYFIAQNLTTATNVSTGSYFIQYVDTPAFVGFQLFLTTSSDSVFKAQAALGNVQVQLSYSVPGLKSTLAVFSATQLPTVNAAGEYTYQFDIATNFDVDANNLLQIVNAHMGSKLNQIQPMALETTFNIVYILTNYAPVGIQTSSIDSLVQTYEFAGSGAPIYVGVSQESIDITLGWALTNLWQNTRTVAGALNYQTYPTDVPAYYTEDVYQVGPGGVVAITADPNTGAPLAIKLHAMGDPVLDIHGNPTYIHRAGDFVLDSFGNPIVIGGSNIRAMVRQADMLVLDGRYYFATDSATVSYITGLASTIVQWITQEIETIQTNMMERTELYFYPKSTIGMINVDIGNGQIYQINSEQSLTVTYTLSPDNYNNSALRASLASTTTQIIDSMLNNSTVAVTLIEQQIAAQVGNDIISVDITGLGGALSLRTITMTDGSIKPSVAKTAVVLADLTVAVQDSIVINFVQQGS